MFEISVEFWISDRGKDDSRPSRTSGPRGESSGKGAKDAKYKKG